MSYIARSGATAVVRAATIEDKVAVARLVVRESGRLTTSRRQQDRLLETLSFLRDRRTIIHVVELEQRLCAAAILRVASQWRIFASAPLVSETGRAFEPALPLKMIEHAVQCCQADGWSALRYLADLERPLEISDHFERLGYTSAVDDADIGLGDWLLYGQRSHELCFNFRLGDGGPDGSDPRIVWF